jgi:hypothetical protein
LNRFCPKKPNRTETGRFELVSVFFLKKINLVIFLIKTEPNRKWSPLNDNINKSIKPIVFVGGKNRYRKKKKKKKKRRRLNQLWLKITE